MPIPSPGIYNLATQTTSTAIKAKTDLIGATVALEDGGNVAAIKAKTDLIGATVALEDGGNVAAIKAKTDPLRGNVYVISDDVLLAGSNAMGWNSASYIKLRSFGLPHAVFPGGAIRIAFTLTNSGTNTVNAHMYRNGVAVGPELGTATTANISEDIVAAWAAGDTIEIWGKVTGGGVGAITNVQIRGLLTYGFVQVV